jgi:hypothetical protein
MHFNQSLLITESLNVYTRVSNSSPGINHVASPSELRCQLSSMAAANAAVVKQSHELGHQLVNETRLLRNFNFWSCESDQIRRMAQTELYCAVKPSRYL